MYQITRIWSFLTDPAKLARVQTEAPEYDFSDARTVTVEFTDTDAPEDGRQYLSGSYGPHLPAVHESGQAFTRSLAEVVDALRGPELSETVPVYDSELVTVFVDSWLSRDHVWSLVPNGSWHAPDELGQLLGESPTYDVILDHATVDMVNPGDTLTEDLFDAWLAAQVERGSVTARTVADYV